MKTEKGKGRGALDVAPPLLESGSQGRYAYVAYTCFSLHLSRMKDILLKCVSQEKV